MLRQNKQWSICIGIICRVISACDDNDAHDVVVDSTYLQDIHNIEYKMTSQSRHNSDVVQCGDCKTAMEYNSAHMNEFEKVNY